MNENSMEKWWNEICGGGKRDRPREKPTQTPFLHHETHMKWQRRELGVSNPGPPKLIHMQSHKLNWATGRGPYVQFNKFI